ncbi:MAG: hypothetical protein M1813_008048 [Trichoglossum hirsutum]|nr:MAG: hypothetical protein M1813_008048 [Trichoglossum hirsutum]
MAPSPITSSVSLSLPQDSSPVARDSQKFTLSTGDVLGYAEYGLERASPVFYFHGSPGSRLEGEFLAESAVAAGARIIAIDRPGIGLSTFREGRKFLDWPRAVAELARHLGIKRFSLLGMSGGAPYVLACAKEVPAARLRGVGIIAGQGPTSLGTGGMTAGKKFMMFMASWMSSVFDWMLSRAARNPDSFSQLLLEKLSQYSEQDRVCLKDDRVKNRLIAMVKECLRQGGGGLAYEVRLAVGMYWDFELKDVHCKVKIWCGDQDKICPAETGRIMAGCLERAELKVFPGEGHISVITNHGKDILAELLSKS